MTVRDLLMSAGGAGSPPVYVEDVFSTYLYTGNGSTQTITNGIDLAGKGGMVWLKCRSNVGDGWIQDTVLGTDKGLNPDYTGAAWTGVTGYGVTSFNSSGFGLGPNYSNTNTSSQTYASWTFRKQPKFFDVVQYTGTGVAQAISHRLGSTPGCIMIKETSATNNWAVYHKGANGGTTPEQYYTVLNTTAAQVASSAWWNNTAPTTTQFTVGTDATVNASGGTYIAYIFADQAGGFGASGSDSAIACGGYTGTGATGKFVNLGWEPQYVMVKETDTTGNWVVKDVMRGMAQTQGNELFPNLATAENLVNTSIVPAATGFYLNTTTAALNTSAGTYIYIAIRRPMKPPTTGTSVFSPVNITAPIANQTVTTNMVTDLVITGENSQSFQGNWFDFDRLRGSRTTGPLYCLLTNGSGAEITTGTHGFGFDSNTSVIDNEFNFAGVTDKMTYWNFRRAPTFFDEVCYTGTGAVTTQSHNLTVAPEMMIVKERSASNNWWVYHSATGNTKYSVLNTTAIPVTSSTAWNNTTPTASVFSIGTGANVNASSQTYVAYLFATCAGVSKVGTYTGNATGQSIACGFGSGGARFILIKRTDSTGDWYVFDSANGLTSSSSPYLTWDTINAQTTGNNGVYASSGGFTLGATASLTTNIATATYIFLAIA